MIDTPQGRKSAKGDSARGSLHLDTCYGSIEREGELKYVVRRTLDEKFSLSDAEKIVDEVVREKVKAAFAKGKITLPVYMNEEKGIEIKKVRCFAPSVKNPLHIRRHRDESLKEYKRQFHVANDMNYCMAIYEGIVRGKVKRDFELVNNLDAAKFFKRSTDRNDYPALVPATSEKGFPLKQLLRIGQMVLLYENTPDEIDFCDAKDISKRLYKIVGMSSFLASTNYYGTIVMRHHQEARNAKEVTITKGAYKANDPLRPSVFLLHTQFNALVENIDFEVTPLGEIKRK